MINETIDVKGLRDCAERLRNREESIKPKVIAGNETICEVLGLATEQGRDLIIAETLLHGRMRLSDWLLAHVPTLSACRAQKYINLSQGKYADPRQCILRLGDEPKQIEGDRRPSPKAWQSAAGAIGRLWRTVRDAPINTWPPIQVDTARKSLEPIARLLWPDKFA